MSDCHPERSRRIPWNYLKALATGFLDFARNDRFFIRRSFFVLLLFPPDLQAAENIGVLGNKPRWDVLEHYQQTITRDEFAHLINDVYGTHGFAPDLVKIQDDTARILMNRDAQKYRDR